LAFVENGRCQLVSRNGHAFSQWDSLTREIAASLRCRSAVLDGEIACLDPVESRVRFVDHVHETGVRVFELACERDLEGLVAKYARGVYHTNHAITSWLKIKHPHLHASGATRRTLRPTPLSRTTIPPKDLDTDVRCGLAINLLIA